MMLCAKNYCTLLIFGRVIFKIEGGGHFFETQCIIHLLLHYCLGRTKLEVVYCVLFFVLLNC